MVTAGSGEDGKASGPGSELNLRYGDEICKSYFAVKQALSPHCD